MRIHRSHLAVALFVCLVHAPVAHAFGTARKGFGIGLGSGTIANGLSAKIMAGPGAFQGVAGFWGGGGAGKRFGKPGGVAGSLDYLFEMPTLARSQYFTIDWSFGIGAGIGASGSDGKLGAAGAGIAGIEFNFTTVPIDLAIEFRPSLAVLPDPGLHLVDFTAHLRLWL